MDLRQFIQGPNKPIWRTSPAKDLGRLRMTCGTSTVFYVPKSSVPSNRKVTYARMVATIRPNKTEVNRVRVTVGGNILNYPDATTTNFSSLSTTKSFLNSTT